MNDPAGTLLLAWFPRKTEELIISTPASPNKYIAPPSKALLSINVHWSYTLSLFSGEPRAIAPPSVAVFEENFKLDMIVEFGAVMEMPPPEASATFPINDAPPAICMLPPKINIPPAVRGDVPSLGYECQIFIDTSHTNDNVLFSVISRRRSVEEVPTLRAGHHTAAVCH